MSITAIAEKHFLKILSSSGPIPEGSTVELFTEDEIEIRVAQRVWSQLNSETKDDLLFQTQAHFYQEWMEDDVWDVQKMQKSTHADLKLSDFKP